MKRKPSPATLSSLLLPTATVDVATWHHGGDPDPYGVRTPIPLSAHHSAPFHAHYASMDDSDDGYCRDFRCCGIRLHDLHALVLHYEKAHVVVEPAMQHPFLGGDEAMIESAAAEIHGGHEAAFERMVVVAQHRRYAQFPSAAAAASSDEDSARSGFSTPLHANELLSAAYGGMLVDTVDASVGVRPGIYQTRRRNNAYAQSSCLPGSNLNAAGNMYYSDDDDTASTSSSSMYATEAATTGMRSLVEVAVASGTAPRIPAPMLAPISTSAALAATADDMDENEDEDWHSVIAAIRSTSVLDASSSAVDTIAPADLIASTTAALVAATAFSAAPVAAKPKRVRRSDPSDDKPYKCMVPGCEKAYKNPNGLKYHNVHGHVALAMQLGVSDDGLGSRSVKKMRLTPPGSPGSRPVAAGIPQLQQQDGFTPASTVPSSPTHLGTTFDANCLLDLRPYKCPLAVCGKTYKNMNGLKYHTEHAHPGGAVNVPAGRKARAKWDTERRAEWLHRELKTRLGNAGTTGGMDASSLDGWLAAVAAKAASLATPGLTPATTTCHTPAGSQSPLLHTSDLSTTLF